MTGRTLLVSFSLVTVLGVAGCNAGGEGPSTSTQATPPKPVATVTINDESEDPGLVTLKGVGGVTPGMGVAEVEQAWGVRLRVSKPSEGSTCSTAELPGSMKPLQGYLLFERGKFGAVFFDGGSVRTPEGITRGSTEADLKAAYPNLTSEPAKYVKGTDYFLASTANPNWAVRFETEGGKVEGIDFGGPEVHYVEACS